LVRQVFSATRWRRRRPGRDLPRRRQPVRAARPGRPGLPAWTVSEAWLLNSPARETNHHADITATFDRKATAVRAHRSQIENPDTLPERLRDRIAANTAAAGLPGDRLAEAFQVVLTG